MKKTTAFTLLELLIVVATIAVLAAIAVPNFLEAQTRSKVATIRSDQAVMGAAMLAYYADYRVYPPNNVDSAAFFRACTKIGEVNGETVPTPAGAGMPWVSSKKQKDRWTQDYPLDQLDEPFSSVPPNAKPVTDPVVMKDEYGAPLGQTYPRWQPEAYHFSTPLSPAFDACRYDLNVLTSPLAYFSTQAPFDKFADTKGIPMAYVNLADAWDGSPSQQSGRGIPRYVLLSYGPDVDEATRFTSTILNPVKGPWQHYDPTNGTISQGDLLSFGD